MQGGVYSYAILITDEKGGESKCKWACFVVGSSVELLIVWGHAVGGKTRSLRLTPVLICA